MARTHKSQVSDFIKDMLFNGVVKTEVKKDTMKTKITKVLNESPHWKSTTITKDNKKVIGENIHVQVSVGDTVAFNNRAFAIKKEKNSNGCTIVANVKRGKLISVTHAKENKQLMFVL
jgi:hypothetical protein